MMTTRATQQARQGDTAKSKSCASEQMRELTVLGCGSARLSRFACCICASRANETTSDEATKQNNAASGLKLTCSSSSSSSMSSSLVSSNSNLACPDSESTTHANQNKTERESQRAER
jgi:hypothetical protein